MSIIGIGAYGFLHPKFPSSYLLTVLKAMKKPCLSILWNTFGNNNEALQRYLEIPKDKILQIHAINEVGHRNGNLGKYEVLSGISVSDYNRKLCNLGPKLVEKLNLYFADMSRAIGQPKYPYTLFLSPGLESNLCVEAFKKLSTIAKAHLPNARIVYNPNYENKFNNKPLSGYLYESHRLGYSGSAQFIVNNDGYDVAFIPESPEDSNQISVEELKKYIQKSSKAKINFLWSMRMNGRAPGAFIDPRKRKNWPTLRELDAIAKFLL